MIAPESEYGDNPWELIAGEEIRPVEESTKYYALPVYFVTASGKMITLLGNYPKIVKGCLTHNGYIAVSLTKFYPKKTTKMLHRLIAEAFLGDTKGKQVHHKNGIRSDNRLENLEIVDSTKHGKRHKQLNKERRRRAQEFNNLKQRRN